MKKLYCYVDETGQDTHGGYFIVAIIISETHQHELEAALETLEAASGKKTAKWLKTRDTTRQAFVQALTEQPIPVTMYAKHYIGGKHDYDKLEVLATAQALNVYRQEHSISENSYKVTVTVDGLSKDIALRMGGELRKLGVRTRKVVGKTDESSAMLRLADAIAGLEREAHEGRKVYQLLKDKLKRAKKLYEL